MNKTLLKIALLFGFLTSSNHALPVIDAPQVIENGQTAARWLQQGKQWRKEIKQWKQQYDAVTGFKLDGKILDKISQINNLLKGHGLDMGDLDLSNPKSQIGVLAKQLFDSYTLFKDCEFDFMTADQQRICKDTTVRRVQEMATAKEFQDQVGQMLEKLNDLNTQLANAKDIKTSQDTTAAIESTVSSLEIMNARFEMMMMRNKAKEGIDRRQSQQLRMKRFENSEAFYKKSIF